MKQNIRRTIMVFLIVSLFVWFLGSQTASAEQIVVQEQQITSSGNYNTNPTIGADSTGPLVVYTGRLITSGGLGPGSIYYQRLKDGAPDGSPVLVSSGGTDNELNDVSGSRIVYTAFVSQTTVSGTIMLYDIATSTSSTVATASSIRGARIHGDKIVWVQDSPLAARLMLYDVSQIGTGAPPQILAGPTPTAGSVEIGDRFVVFDVRPIGSYRDLYAYELATGVYHAVATDPSLDERAASTCGPWVAWEAQTPGTTKDRIEAMNLETGERRIVVDNGSVSYAPTMSGNLITYESKVNGNFNIWVYRIQQGDTFQVTTNSFDQRLNNVFGNMVAYVDARIGSYEVFVSTLAFNNPPTANAGINQTVPVGALVTLDGSGSSDPEGNVPLTYAWSFQSKPVGSAASLSSASSVNPTFTPDIPGDYVVQLIVTDSLGATSQPATVTISMTNTAPLASAGPGQAVTVIGSIVQLDGSQSYDPDGNTISYQWSFVSVPAGSAANLSNQNIVNPTFIADVHGTYIVQLIVRDPWTQSIPASVTVSFENVKPVADAGTSQSAMVGDMVTLNGSGSSDANGDQLTYQWSLASVPAESQATIESPAAVTTTFIPDLPGTYVAHLIVNDGFVNSDPSTVQVQVVPSQTNAIQATKDIQTVMASLNTSVLKNDNLQNAFLNKLNAVIASISTGNYKDALDQLQNDVLLKTDGCAKTGAPDKNDWIKTCDAQNQVYPYVMDVIQLLRNVK